MRIIVSFWKRNYSHKKVNTKSRQQSFIIWLGLRFLKLYTCFALLFLLATCFQKVIHNIIYIAVTFCTCNNLYLCYNNVCVSCFIFKIAQKVAKTHTSTGSVISLNPLTARNSPKSKVSKSDLLLAYLVFRMAILCHFPAWNTCCFPFIHKVHKSVFMSRYLVIWWQLKC